MWNNMKMKKKLILAFVMVGLFSAIVGGFGLGAIYSTNDNTDEIYKEHFIPSTYLSEIQKNLSTMDQTFILMLYERDMLQTESRLKIIEKLKEENEILLSEFEKTGGSDQSCEAFRKDLSLVYGVMDRLGDLLLGFDYSGAMNLAPDFHSKINVVDKDIQRLVDGGIQRAGVSLQKAHHTFLFAFVAMVGISVLCLAVAVTAGGILSRKIGKPIAELAEAAEKLAVGDVEIDVESKLNDEVGHLVKAFGRMAENIKVHAETARDVAEGRLEIEVEPLSEKDVLGTSMKSVVSTLRLLVDETKEMTDASLKGDLANRGREELFCGGYRDIIQGFNHTLAAVIEPMNLSAAYLKRISRGDIPDSIMEEYPGDFNRIKESLNTCIDAVKEMIADVHVLSKAAIEGNLHMRADAAKHEGDFNKIVSGFNQTLDAVVEPLHIAAEYIEKIGRGEIPPRLTQTYEGEFNDLKNSINCCIEGLGALDEGNQILRKMRDNDFTGQVRQTGQGIFSELSESINEVSCHINEIICHINHVAEGNLQGLKQLKSTGVINEHDILTPALTKMTENLKCITTEIFELSEAAIEGRLDQRGAAEQFGGEYGTIIDGINRTLDALIQPTQEASIVLEEIAEGNLEKFMIGSYKGDHAELKNAVNTSTRSLQHYIDEISQVLSEISRGNLDVAISEDYKGNFIAIKHSLHHIVDTLNQVIGEIGEAADLVADGSRQMLEGSRNLAQGSMEQAGSIEALSAVIAETAGHFKQNTVRAAKASTLADFARDNVKKGNHQMAELVESMSTISRSSSEISKINHAIGEIAFQTNILALNAAVEAARAGRQGKGFAVVADEVRRLAVRSAEAARQTNEIIEETIIAVQAGAENAENSAAVFAEILEAVDQTADWAVKLSSDSREQETSIIMINQGIDQISGIVQKNSATAEQSAAISEKLHVQAEHLNAMVDHFTYRKKVALPELPGPIRLLERRMI